jgi:cyclic di-GMP phosphodiesterase
MDILIVDDDALALDLLRNSLRSMGHTVSTANNGAQALQMLREDSCRVVISDWEMPEMDGLELCRRVRRRASSAYTYFILLTSRDSGDDIIEGLGAGADDFLVKPFRPAELRVRLQGAQRLLSLESRNVTIFVLAKLAESRDPDTGAHLERMREYARILAVTMSALPKYADVIDVEYAKLIHLTAPLHDIGKVGVPDCILLKPGPLTPEERLIMQTHADIGADTLAAAAAEFPDADYLKMACELARSHHEHYDGTGYPAGLAGDAIPLCARIAAVADVYDALTSDRVYRPAMTHAEARALVMRGSGTHFDPDVVAAFVAAEEEFLAVRRRHGADGAPASVAARTSALGAETQLITPTGLT